MSAIPAAAQAVIIGGGIVGCSTAYHLARLGHKEIVLLERAKLTSGSTWHAAGLVGQLRTSANVTQLLKYSVELYDRLEKETGLSAGWKRNGGLRLACNRERLTEIKRQATTAHSFGLEMHLLSPAEAKALWPIMDATDIVGAAFLPTDGQVSPSDLAQALAKGARMQGVKVIEECRVTGIQVEDGRVCAVETSQGAIRTEIVVNCAGQWARHIGQLAGANVPLVSVQHQYIITEPIEGVARNLPTLRDPDRLIYFKEEVGGLVMGGYEPDPIAWALEGIPEGFEFQLLGENWDHFEQHMTQAMARVPALEKAGIKQLINGPESFTPDGNFILGEAPEVRGFFVGAGFNAFGIASAGGAGRALAEWVAAGEPPMDLWPVDIRRFGPHHRSEEWVRKRTHEAYGKHYTMAWPFEEYGSARPLRVSPLYRRLKEQGACFGEKLGWERPNWFAPVGVEPKDVYTYDRQNWFPHVAAEHAACRQRVALFDQTSFAKFMLTGRDAERALQWICANDVAKPPGRLTYTQMLNARGGIECDLTVARLSPGEFYIVTGTGFATHDFAWIQRNIPEDCADAKLADVTCAWSVLALMGPQARAVLSKVTRADLSNGALPFGTCAQIDICGALVRALRVTYVGELGWELHIPVEQAAMVYDRLMAAGKEHGIANAGYRAIESLRLEKAYRAWGSDIGPDHTPLEAGLAWAVKLAKDIPFLGREALLAQRSQPLKKKLACFTVDDPDIVLLGRETIYRDGERVGWLSSAGWGHTVQENIGFGYVRNAGRVDEAMLKTGTYELEVAAERHPCTLHLTPLYDPRGERIRS
ncbi:MAG: FAD-dependent oxidoreductase [Burkholderiales bacterium]